MELREKIAVLAADAVWRWAQGINGRDDPEWSGDEAVFGKQLADAILAIPEIRDALGNRALSALYAIAEGGQVRIMTAKDGGQLIGEFSLEGQAVNSGDTITLPPLKFQQP